MQQNATKCRFEKSDSWVILSPIEQKIKEKIESIGVPLREWDINIYRGVLTGYNEAFVISGAKRQEILENCNNENERQRTAELIRPILRGRDIKRYNYVWDDKWLIATFPSRKFDVEEYPAVKQYLLSFGKERLMQSGDKGSRKKTNNKWFETQDSINYWEDFLKPKIVWKRVGSILRFSYDNNSSMALDSTCFATGNYIKYLVATLNSKMGHYLLKNAPKTGTGDLLISVQAVEPIKVPIPSEETNKHFMYLLNKQLICFSELIDSQINNMVYDIYNLSKEEIEFIENEVDKL